jgi:hypothetical protein
VQPARCSSGQAAFETSTWMLVVTRFGIETLVLKDFTHPDQLVGGVG